MIAGLPDPSAMLRQKLPVVLCTRCDGSKWDPLDPNVPCRNCHGYGGVVNTKWDPVRKPAPRVQLGPRQVRSLRAVGCLVPEYPKDGTPEWDAFVAGFKEKLKAIPRAPPVPNLRRGRGKKRLITSLAHLPTTVPTGGKP